MASGIARGEGLGAAAATSAPETTALTVVVTATAPTPAALMKFLREYSIFKPPYSGRGDCESQLDRHRARRSGLCLRYIEGELRKRALQASAGHAGSLYRPEGHTSVADCQRMLGDR